MRWFDKADFDFLGNRKWAYAWSLATIIFALVVILVKGLQFGIDFTGGKEFVLQFEKAPEITKVRDVLTGELATAPLVKTYGSSTEIVIRTAEEGTLSDVEQKIRDGLQQIYPDNKITVEKSSLVGARFAQDLQKAAINAVIFALIIIGIYIFIRFKSWTYAVAACYGLAHDVFIVLGILTFLSGMLPFNLHIGQTLVAAFLTIVGYSINDTVVVYDRVRERLNTHKTEGFMETVNKGMNDTLSRTVLTSVTTFFAALVLFIFGGQTLKGFSLALMIGLVTGTYSSIFMATSIAVDLERLTGRVKEP
ncbi:MAG TPA: protein translocase subunit SecF [Balneolaceae bacterium]|nr:protein translocase subunit SecF [Balneolaceae bacterium]